MFIDIWDFKIRYNQRISFRKGFKENGMQNTSTRKKAKGEILSYILYRFGGMAER